MKRKPSRAQNRAQREVREELYHRELQKLLWESYKDYCRRHRNKGGR